MNNEIKEQIDNLEYYKSELDRIEPLFWGRYAKEKLTDAYLTNDNGVYHINNVSDKVYKENEDTDSYFYRVKVLGVEYIPMRRFYRDCDEIMYPPKVIFISTSDYTFRTAQWGSSKLNFITKEKFDYYKEWYQKNSERIEKEKNKKNETDYKRYIELKEKFRNS